MKVVLEPTRPKTRRIIILCSRAFTLHRLPPINILFTHWNAIINNYTRNKNSKVCHPLLVQRWFWNAAPNPNQIYFYHFITDSQLFVVMQLWDFKFSGNSQWFMWTAHRVCCCKGMSIHLLLSTRFIFTNFLATRTLPVSTIVENKTRDAVALSNRVTPILTWFGITWPVSKALYLFNPSQKILCTTNVKVLIADSVFDRWRDRFVEHLKPVSDTSWGSFSCVNSPIIAAYKECNLEKWFAFWTRLVTKDM